MNVSRSILALPLALSLALPGAGVWLSDGVGVTPDVEVDNLPHETFAGRDRQLEVALELLEKKMKEQPVKPWKPAAIPALKR